jgi:hypothetical protein
LSGFSSEWLALREPYDLRARDSGVIAALIAWTSDRHGLSLVDLACGTGAAMRALSPRLPMRQNWLMVDNNLSLLARAGLSPPAHAAVTTMPVDIVHDLEAALDGTVDVVTASALLDLVSEEWLDRLVTEIAVRRLALYASLIYDGRIAFTPKDKFDKQVIAAVNTHQRTDKGFGPALGPDAAHQAADRFRTLGYAVEVSESDWNLTAADKAIQIELLDGYAGAARSTGRLSLSDLVGWLTRRRAAVAAGEATLLVGHIDFFAAPIGRR